MLFFALSSASPSNNYPPTYLNQFMFYFEVLDTPSRGFVPARSPLPF